MKVPKKLLSSLTPDTIINLAGKGSEESINDLSIRSEPVNSSNRGLENSVSFLIENDNYRTEYQKSANISIIDDPNNTPSFTNTLTSKADITLSISPQETSISIPVKRKPDKAPKKVNYLRVCLGIGIIGLTYLSKKLK
jgi:hypothetical protein